MEAFLYLYQKEYTVPAGVCAVAISFSSSSISLDLESLDMRYAASRFPHLGRRRPIGLKISFSSTEVLRIQKKIMLAFVASSLSAEY